MPRARSRSSAMASFAVDVRRRRAAAAPRRDHRPRPVSPLPARRSSPAPPAGPARRRAGRARCAAASSRRRRRRSPGSARVPRPARPPRSDRAGPRTATDRAGRRRGPPTARRAAAAAPTTANSTIRDRACRRCSPYRTACRGGNGRRAACCTAGTAARSRRSRRPARSAATRPPRRSDAIPSGQLEQQIQPRAPRPCRRSGTTRSSRADPVGTERRRSGQRFAEQDVAAAARASLASQREQTARSPRAAAIPTNVTASPALTPASRRSCRRRRCPAAGRAARSASSPQVRRRREHRRGRRPGTHRPSTFPDGVLASSSDENTGQLAAIDPCGGPVRSIEQAPGCGLRLSPPRVDFAAACTTLTVRHPTCGSRCAGRTPWRTS